VINAVDYIAELRQAKNYSDMKVGANVVVIGGGNTAIDIAIQSKALGAESVTLVYRRGAKDMSATGYEQELAQTRGVQILFHSKPVAIEGSAKGVSSITFEQASGERFTLQADMVFKAVGQLLTEQFLLPEYEGLELDGKKIKVDAKKQTTLKGVYAGGDCIHHKEDLTVAAVQDGKLAGFAIHEALTGEVLPTNFTKKRPSTFDHAAAGGHHHG
jgi:dihydropyrimidine dehydrogenase (NAD+) subunit PreT